jgi:hypothetical protein
MTCSKIRVTDTLNQCRMNTGEKKLEPLPVRAAKMLRRLRHVQGLSEEEKSVHALGLAATPEERWELFVGRMRSFGYWKPLKRNKSGM